MRGRISSQLHSDRESFGCGVWMKVIKLQFNVVFHWKRDVYIPELCVRSFPPVSSSSSSPALLLSGLFSPFVALVRSKKVFQKSVLLLIDVTPQWFNKQPVRDSVSSPWTNEGFSTFQSNPQGDLCSQSSGDQQMVSWQPQNVVKGANKCTEFDLLSEPMLHCH